MEKNKVIGFGVVAALVIAGIAFYSGAQYAKSTSNSLYAQNSQRGGMMNGSTGRRGAIGGMGGFIGGEVLSKDAQSITIKLRDGGSKIVFVASSTQISKSAPGNIDDVAIGSQIMVTGSTNSDGSATAQTIQIR